MKVDYERVGVTIALHPGKQFSNVSLVAVCLQGDPAMGSVLSLVEK